MPPTTYCQTCGRIVGFDPTDVITYDDRNYLIDPPGQAVHAFLDCSHEKNLVTVLPVPIGAAA